ncbi:hypothetical protein AVEN_11496-1 [Araneus ventricosus]|uniref:Uncharacterized protein n=1 Tax=Araneus ventricosus TaxID=182803 RepID=A0A4Y2A911_ARAVE|nr:hypothetical protein AVEN_11496-1 [Araneus ventricosus]
MTRGHKNPKLKCPSLDMLHQPPPHLPSDMSESLKHHYLHYGLPPKHAAEVSISSSTSPTSPHHVRITSSLATLKRDSLEIDEVEQPNLSSPYL